VEVVSWFRDGLTQKTTRTGLGDLLSSNADPKELPSDSECARWFDLATNKIGKNKELNPLTIADRQDCRWHMSEAIPMKLKLDRQRQIKTWRLFGILDRFVDVIRYITDITCSSTYKTRISEIPWQYLRLVFSCVMSWLRSTCLRQHRTHMSGLIISLFRHSPAGRHCSTPRNRAEGAALAGGHGVGSARAPALPFCPLFDDGYVERQRCFPSTSRSSSQRRLEWLLISSELINQVICTKTPLYLYLLC
jgi:hypothetical protein